MSRLLVVFIALVTVAGCGPRRTAAPPGVTYADSYAAIDTAFARFGPNVIACAHGVADRESGHWWASDNGTHHGMFQLHDGWWSSIVAAGQHYGRPPSWYDPLLNASAAAIGFDAARGTPTDGIGSFRRNWPSTVPSGCP